MKNRLIVSAAGSGKTTLLVKDALAVNKKFNIIITTFTEANESEIRKKFFEINGFIPSNVTIQTWFSFLIQHGVKPYQDFMFDNDVTGLLLVNKQSGVKYFNKQLQRNVYYADSEKECYFSKSKIYSDKLAKFVTKCNKNSSGLIIKRIEKIYDFIFIDEVQDMAGYDLDIIKLLMMSRVKILLVGDPRQTTYLTHHERKYEKYSNGLIKNFIKNECKKIECKIDEDTLNISYRCNKSIVDFSNLLYPSYKQCISGQTRTTGHDGIFIVKRSDLIIYMETYLPLQLRYDSSNSKIVLNYPIMNLGVSKGLTVDRVLIYPTKDMKNWLLNNNEIINYQTRAKFYVGITRARFSVAILLEDEEEFFLEGAQLYSAN